MSKPTTYILLNENSIVISGINEPRSDLDPAQTHLSRSGPGLLLAPLNVLDPEVRPGPDPTS